MVRSPLFILSYSKHIPAASIKNMKRISLCVNERGLGDAPGVYSSRCHSSRELMVSRPQTRQIVAHCRRRSSEGGGAAVGGDISSCGAWLYGVIAFGDVMEVSEASRFLSGHIKRISGERVMERERGREREVGWAASL